VTLLTLQPYYALLQGTLQLHLCGALTIFRRVILIAKDGEQRQETKIPQKTVGLHPKPEECKQSVDSPVVEERRKAVGNVIILLG